LRDKIKNKNKNKNKKIKKKSKGAIYWFSLTQFPFVSDDHTIYILINDMY
jgi:hypothetical protein